LDDKTAGTWTAGTWTGTSMTLTRQTVKSDVVQSNPLIIGFNSATNPAYSACSYSAPVNGSTGTCYVRINTYTDTAGTAAADDAIVSMTVTRQVTVSARVDPVFTFTVTGTVGAAQVVNGTTLTNGITTTITTIPFGNLTVGQVKYASQNLNVTTNAVNGYFVSAKLQTNLIGQAYGHDIDPFAAPSADSTHPQTWSSPTGVASGTNSGWIGVGTDDPNAAGREANKFYPLNTTALILAKSTTSASSRNSNLVYAIEVNAYQQSDNYTGILVYNATTTY
jgi:hypothetical protein